MTSTAVGLFSVPTYDVAKLGGVDAAVENVKVDGVGVMADWQTVWATDVSQTAKNINKNKTSFANMFDMIIDSLCRKDCKRWAVIDWFRRCEVQVGSTCIFRRANPSIDVKTH